MDWEKIKLGAWSAVGGAIILAIVGFTWPAELGLT